MKNFLIVGLLLLVIALIVGVEPVQRAVNEGTQRGTLRGVETCMEYTGSGLLSEEAVRATCVSTFQKRLYGGDYATGRAGPKLGQSTVVWEGILNNETSDHVTTWVRIAVSLYDEDGAEREYFGETPIWIDPLSDARFEVELPELEQEQLEEIEFCDLDELAPKACVSWGVVGVMGVAI